MKKIIGFAITLLFSVIAISFALMNAEPVHLSYYIGEIQAPLSLVVVLAIATGALFGVLASMGMVVGQKREIAKLRKSIKITEEEVTNLRSLPLNDGH